MEAPVYDFCVVGSGFGGAVSALRLTEKGYRVLVLEAGPRFRPRDFAKSNWNLRRFVYLPAFGLKGIMRMDFFKGLMVLSGAGVGGGSLVYANTLIEPSRDAFKEATWPKGLGVENWDEELREHYQEAKRMLGVASCPVDFPADRAMKAASSRLGYGDTFHEVQVGVYFGEPGKTGKDPYFGGEGPERTGCTFCGACMIGCREGAKNTLDKNYLYLAEKRGAVIRPESQVVALEQLANGRYELTVRRPGVLPGRRVRVSAKNVVLAAGVLGTMKLLLKCRDEIKTLPRISPKLGTEVRTNSESIIGVRSYGSKVDYSKGLAIASGVNPDSHTKIEAVRYPAGSDLISVLSMPLIEGRTWLARLRGVAAYLIRNPIRYWREWWPKGFAKETIILLVMQSLDSKIGFRWRRGPFTMFRKGLTAEYSKGGRPPVHIPEGNAFAKELAKEIGGNPGGSVSDVLNMSVTAHILGGCPMGRDESEGVIDVDHRVHGYPGLYVVGGAAVPANLGVNPSLTITAMAERAMARVPAATSLEEGERVA